MAQTSRAWVLDVGAGQRAAAGAPHVVEFLLATETLPVPCTPRHCRGLLLWRGRMIPVVDLAPLLAAGATAATATRRAVVLAWQPQPGEPLEYGALLVTAAPGETWVNDDMAGDLADTPEAMRNFARAGFMNQDRLIPILDIRQLFGRPLPAEMLGSGLEGKRDIHLAEAAPVVDDTSSHRAVAESMPMWRTISNAIDLPAPRAETDTPDRTPDSFVMDETPEAATSAVVLPFSAGKIAADEGASQVALRAESEEIPIFAPEVPVLEGSLPRDEGLMLTVATDVVEAASLANAEPLESVPIRDESPSMLLSRSVTLESFERLHAIEQKTMPPARDNLRRRVVVFALVLGVLIAASLAIAFLATGTVERNTTVAPRPAMHDVTSGGIDPHSVPSLPAQPPK